MAKTLDKEVVAAIELAILTARKAKKTPDLHTIATTFSCSYQSVCYIRRRIEKLQKTGVDDRKKSGRKPLPEQDRITDAIRDLLGRRPELDQSAVSDYLFDEFGVRLCQATVSRLYKKNAIPHKMSNKLYKKSKLFTTYDANQNLMGSRELAASALSSLTTSSPTVYKSPYGPTAINPVAPNPALEPDLGHAVPQYKMALLDYTEVSSHIAGYSENQAAMSELAESCISSCV